MRSDRVRMICSVALEAFIAVAVPVAWCVMVLGISDNGLLSAKGLETLKYFTVQSNLFAAAASAIAFVYELSAAKDGGRLPVWVVDLRIVAGAGLMLTFLTVAAFLGPLFGYASMFLGTNLWFHLIVPFLCAGGVFLLRGAKMPKKHLPFAFVPIALYTVFYLSNILINGIGTRPHSNDWYNLLNWGVGVGLFLYAALIGLIVGACVLLRLGYNRCNRVEKTPEA